MGTEDVRPIVLIVHIAAGAVAVLLAATVMAAAARQDWSTRWGTAYVGCVVVVALSAVALVAAGSTLPGTARWVLLVIAIVTAAAAIRGLQLARSRRSRPTQLRLMWGSLTSLVSAIAVVSAPVYVWVPVVIIGTVLTELGYRRAQRDPAWA